MDSNRGPKESYLVFCLIVVLTLARQQVLANPVTDERRSSSQQSFGNIPSGEISSPNFPSPYGPDDDSTWTITGASNQKVRLRFEAFMLENSSDCQKDYVAILNGIDGSKKGLQKYCGSKSPFTVTSSSNVMVVTFHSDSQNQYPGFQATFKLISASDDGNSTEREDGGNSTTKKCECGKADERNRRVVGGTVTHPKEFPWLVVLVRKGTPERAHCGAALVCSRYLLTAAHCTYMKEDNYYDAVLGAYDLTNKAPSQQIVGVKRLITHEDYFKPTENNDIAIVELERDVEYNSAVSPICMSPKELNFTGEKGTVAGWGRMKYGGPLSPVPREVLLPIVDNEECQRSFSKANANITDNMMCAGVLDGSIDACQGDSGGPLMWTDPSDQRTKIIGITSFGVRCATIDYYGAYTRVNRYEEWIRSKIGSQCPCLYSDQ